jgi:hypothetical protein
MTHQPRVEWIIETTATIDGPPPGRWAAFAWGVRRSYPAGLIDLTARAIAAGALVWLAMPVFN